MGIPDSSLLDLIEKLRSWVSWRGSDLQVLSVKSDMLNNSREMCCECNRNLNEMSNKYNCKSCGRWLCWKCMQDSDFPDLQSDNPGFRETVNSCKFCSGDDRKYEGQRKCVEKVHPSASPQDSPRQSPEPPSPCFSVQSERISSPLNWNLNQGNNFERYFIDQDYRYYLQRSMDSSGALASSVSTHQSIGRSDEDGTEDFGKHHFSSSTTYWHNDSDIDTSSISAKNETYSYKSPSESPSRNDFTSSKVGLPVQQGQERIPVSQHDGPFDKQTTAVLGKPEQGTEDAYNTGYFSDDLSIFRNQTESSQRPLNFENCGLIWFPPPPDDENDEAEGTFFPYDDEDDDVGDSGALFSSSCSLSNVFSAKEKENEGNKEPLKAVIQGHFRALVLQLLQGEGIKVGKEDGSEDWLDIVATLAWQAANYVRPDTSKGGSMDPGNYVKVKCIATGSPTESTLIKGVVCTKNIKHKRMTSQYRKPRLLLLGGALEFQKVPNQLASFDTLLQQENDHLKMIISKIEALRPNVLLVEKSVAPIALEYLLAKEISLVLNVKRPLLDRIARCTGALITPSVDSLSKARLGHCELFWLDRMVEDHETANQPNKKSSKTLMFFKGCPRRLGCTVLLKGACREDLKKIKHVVQYAVFAAYHLSLETSFLADEGATLPKMRLNHSMAEPDRLTTDPNTSALDELEGLESKFEGSGSAPGYLDDLSFPSDACTRDYRIENIHFDACQDDLTSNLTGELVNSYSYSESYVDCMLSYGMRNHSQSDLQESMVQEEGQHGEISKSTKDNIEEDELSGDYFSATDHQSILVYFSSRCVSKGTICEQSRLLRIKFYGSFDKPLGRYLRDDLFDETSCCPSCKEPVEAHVQCYTHQQGNLTINVRCLPSVKLPGERDGKIWMWHRCLKCPHDENGVPPATRRVVMSDAAWGLSLGKFLELSFSNHATANRVAPCGHSLQRDCLRYYGFGSMVAFFRYSPIDILCVHLPPLVMEFDHNQEWIRKESRELLSHVETLYREISDVLESLEKKSSFPTDSCDIHSHITELKDMLRIEGNDYQSLLQSATSETSEPGKIDLDVLELNRLKRSLLIGSRLWDHRLHSLDSRIKGSPTSSINHGNKSREEEPFESHTLKQQDEVPKPCPPEPSPLGHADEEEVNSDESNLSERIDSAWTGTDQPSSSVEPLHTGQADGAQAESIKPSSQNDNPSFRRLNQPMRVHSFDSAIRVQEQIRKSVPLSSHLSTRSFHASGDYRSLVGEPVSNVLETHFQMLSLEAQKLNLILSTTPTFISSGSRISEGVRLLHSQTTRGDRVIAVYDNDYSSIISYALSSKEYDDWVTDKLDLRDGSWITRDRSREDLAVSTFSAWGSLNLDYIHYGNYGPEDAPSVHLRISFGDDSSGAAGKVNFSVTCYFAKQFDLLRKKCCPNEVDFVRSLSRCRRWRAQGGKSNVYFAKSLDERFIIKQVTKTELDSFEEFAPQYFKYLTDSLNSGSPTCLAKILGIYQVTVKYPKGGKETKIDVMVMENLFYRRNIARVYDLKGSERSRYNPDTTGTNKVMLDMNLLEALRTKPIFLGSKAKRSLERAVWNDTSFLASVDVMDYSLLVGVDEERKELVLGIIDFMRQYTWDKHLETWVKASGILGGPRNAAPTIVSPKQYKKRFRKAMTTYFLTLPDQWSS
ncbi:hypothetical protein K1719_033908 [Acacia pycnantha]|nr:hypothetical protein K1719_033908 [Acacia pycnantha]